MTTKQTNPKSDPALPTYAAFHVTEPKEGKKGSSWNLPPIVL